MKKILLLSAGLFLGLSAMAQTVTFDCVADTWIRESAPTAKNGDKDQVELGTDGDDKTARGGLFSFSFNLPAGKKVQSATLHLVSKLCRNGVPVIVYDYPNNYSEADANWESESSYYAKAVAADPITSFTMAGQGNKATFDKGINEDNQTLEKWINDVDVTNFIKSLSPTTKRINFLLTQEAQTRFYSKENVGDNFFKNDDDTFVTSYTADELMPRLYVTFVDDADSNTDVTTSVADTQIRWNNTQNKGGDANMEIYTRLAEGFEPGDENPEYSQEFYGLLRFNIPSEILDPSKYEFTGAELRLVCTQWKRDRNMQIYDYPNDFAESTTFANEETYVREALASTPIAEFEANGASNWSMGDSNRWNDDYATAEAWTSYIDLTDYIAAKAAEGKTSVNILLKRRDDNPSGSGDAMKFATKEAADVTATSTDGTEVTFKAADLVPQLTVTYNKVAAPDDPSAVEAVEVAEGAAEYFTLQGVRVANPEHGIFIRVAGGKAKKVVI